MDEGTCALGALVRPSPTTHQLGRLHPVPGLLRLAARPRGSLSSAAEWPALLWTERSQPAASVLVRVAALASPRRGQSAIRLDPVARFSRRLRALANRVPSQSQSQRRPAIFRI